MAKFVLLLLLGPPVAALLFAASACGEDEQQRQEEPKPRPLPEVGQALRPVQYSSEWFEPPLSFGVGEGWSTSPPETSDVRLLVWAIRPRPAGTDRGPTRTARAARRGAGARSWG
jgi:hypothetical protein